MCSLPNTGRGTSHQFRRKMTMQVISAIAEFERALLLEGTQAGIARAMALGKRLSRPPAPDDEQKKMVFLRLSEGKSISAIAWEFDTTRQTILRLKAIMEDADARS